MLHVVDPFTLVTGAIWLCARALTLQLVLDPSALEHSLVSVDEAALSIRHPFSPLSEVVRLVWKDTETLPVTLIVEPCAEVVSSILQFCLRENGFGLLDEIFDFLREVNFHEIICLLSSLALWRI
jgi:hypothetical protein